MDNPNIVSKTCYRWCWAQSSIATHLLIEPPLFAQAKRRPAVVPLREAHVIRINHLDDRGIGHDSLVALLGKGVRQVMEPAAATF